MWGDERKEKKPSAESESGAQEVKSAKVRRRKEGEERQQVIGSSSFQPPASLHLLHLPPSPPLVSLLVLILFWAPRSRPACVSLSLASRDPQAAVFAALFFFYAQSNRLV